MTHTLYSALRDWLNEIGQSKARTTYKTYSSAAAVLKRAIPKNKPLSDLSAADYKVFIEYLKRYSARSEKLYATIVKLFFEYLAAEEIAKINMSAIAYTRRNNTRKVPKRLRKMDMPALELISERILSLKPAKNDPITARARAFVLLLARSGLRASEAAGLTIEALNPKKMQGTVIGKGNKEARFIFDADCLVALKDYHAIRKVKSPWLFLSHSRKHGKEPRPIDYDTARRDVMRIAKLVLSEDPEFPITPHQFRHLFVSNVWRETGDIKMAQSAARHDNIATTEGYIHDDEEDMDKVAKKLQKGKTR